MNPLNYMRLHDYSSRNSRQHWINASNGKISGTDSRLSSMPKATAGTSRVVKWTRRKLCTTQYTRNSLCNPLVDLAYILVFLRKVAHLRRSELKNASA